MVSHVTKPVDFIVVESPEGNGPVAVRPTADQTMTLEASYHSDHADEWVHVRTIGERREVARFNARTLHSIHFP